MTAHSLPSRARCRGDYALDPTNITPTPVNIGGTVSVDPNGVLTFTPDDPDVYGEYEVEFEFCAQSTPAACSTESVTFIWNDNPNVTGGTSSVAIGSTTSRPIQASAGTSGTGSVTVKVVDFPAVEDTTIWIAVGTPDVTVDLDDTYDGDFPLDPTSIREVSTPDA